MTLQLPRLPSCRTHVVPLPLRWLPCPAPGPELPAGPSKGSTGHCTPSTGCADGHFTSVRPMSLMDQALFSNVLPQEPLKIQMKKSKVAKE